MCTAMVLVAVVSLFLGKGDKRKEVGMTCMAFCAIKQMISHSENRALIMSI